MDNFELCEEPFARDAEFNPLLEDEKYFDDLERTRDVKLTIQGQ